MKRKEIEEMTGVIPVGSMAPVLCCGLCKQLVLWNLAAHPCDSCNCMLCDICYRGCGICHECSFIPEDEVKCIHCGFERAAADTNKKSPSEEGLNPNYV